MWFLLRSAFWLGLVFSRIDWPADLPAVPDSSVVVAAATEKAAALCAANPRPCLTIARKAGETLSNDAPASKPRPSAEAKTRALRPAG